MRANRSSRTDQAYSLEAAIQYYRNCVTQQLKNRHSGYHACTVLKMLGKRDIITIEEIADLRLLKLDGLTQRIMAQISDLRPSTQKVYTNSAKHAIQEFLHRKTAPQG